MRRDNPVYNLMEEGVARANQRKEDNKAVEERVEALEKRVEALEKRVEALENLTGIGELPAVFNGERFREFVADGYGGETEVTSHTPPMEPGPDLFSPLEENLPDVDSNIRPDRGPSTLRVLQESIDSGELSGKKKRWWRR